MLKKKTPILLSFTLPLLAVLLLVSVLRAPSARAAVNATLTVINTNDSGAGSLRRAISDTVAGGTIDFDAGLAGKTITLTTQLVITKNLSISGTVPITISGNDSTRVFYIESANVTLDSLTIANGHTYDDGGGLYLESAVVTITNSFVISNVAGYGGGIESVDTALTIDSSSINNNTGFDGGGGIDSWAGSSLVLTNSFVQGNSTYYVGGGLWSDVNTTISGGVFENNFAYEEGGAIYYGSGEMPELSESVEFRDEMVGSPMRSHVREHAQLVVEATAVLTPSLIMTDVNIISNTASVGGGLFSAENTIITGGAFEYNYADYAGGAVYYGEAVGGEFPELVEGITAVLSPTLTMIDVDVISNTSDYVGGGLASSENTAVSGGTFENNYADYAGGGIYYGVIEGGERPSLVTGATAVLSPTLTMTNVNIISNTAFVGGGLFNGLDATINGGIFENNLAFDGGGIFNGVAEGEILQLEGLTESNSIPNRWHSDNDGAALQVSITAVSVPSITLTDVDIISNTAYIGGGSSNANGMMTINSSKYVSNTGGLAGGAESSFGILSIADSTFTDNTADQFGGGIATNASLVTITNSTFSRNTAGYGGGIYGQFLSDHTILDSIVSENSATYSGGGIYVIGDTSLNVEKTAVVSNTAEYERGGGIYIRNNSQAQLLNSTISGNQALGIEGTLDDLGNGGGIYVGAPIPERPNTITVTHSTITNNYAAGEGGGMDFNRGAPGDILTFQNSILAGNSATGAHQDCYDYDTVNYTFNSDAYNIFSGAAGDDCIGVMTDISLTGLGLTIADVVNPLADNGGNTLTHALVNSSPALNTDDRNCPSVDQRGIARPQDTACDSGAYEAIQYELTVGIVGSGTVSNTTGIDCGVDCAETYVTGSVVTLTATPAIGYSFTGWTGDCSGAGNCSVTMTATAHVTATFTINTYDLTVGLIGSGTVNSTPSGINCGVDCVETYDYGTVVTLTATPAIGYTFTGWTGDCSGAGNCSVTMTATAHVTATFTINTYDLTVGVVDNGTVNSTPSGIDCGIDCAETYDYGTVVTLTATPDAGYSFTGWNGACGGTGDCVVPMTATTHVTATFSIYHIFLPIIMTPPGVPDLVVDSVNLTTDSLEVVIKNIGTGVTNSDPWGGFWVDLYVNPTEVPWMNQTWKTIGGEGLVWGVRTPLLPGESLTLTFEGLYYDASESYFTGTIDAGSTLYAFVDAIGDPSFGAVLESDETNNMMGPIITTINTTPPSLLVNEIELEGLMTERP